MLLGLLLEPLSLSVSLSLEELEEELEEELINDLKLDNVSGVSSSVLEPLEPLEPEPHERLDRDELHELRLLDDEFLDEPLNLQRRPLDPLSPLPRPLYPSNPLSSYHSRIFKTLFSLAVTFSSSRSLFLSSVSTVPITS